ncbi:pilus assembly protein [Pseudomonas subflava]|uniref:pilus assembly protein n=1 Tax=Pseudomonas subflava TaxID=2952933 RepID=UPI00207AE05C|nr:PilC/PilY family type IV pilus protein [Pseudomonas subflava]
MNKKRDTSIKTLSFTLAGFILFSAAQSYADVSQSPLSLTIGVPPNMVLTLDDSGSMRWAFAPDAINGTHATRRAKSSAFNPLYFNPNITYNAPIVFNAAGAEQQLSTTYNAALLNGYKSVYGNIDLRSNYRFTWSYDLLSGQATSYGYSSTSNRLGENPSSDFTASITRNNNGTSTTTNAGITFSITRTGSNSCTATASISGTTITAGCSRTATNTYTASLTQRGVPAYYYLFDASLQSNCDRANDNCYRLVFVKSDQQQNFANWYSFYRNRALATISAAALAFYDLSSSVRLSWQGLGNCTTLNGGPTSDCENNAFREYSPSHKGQLYTWLQNINFDQSTYLPAAMKRAGEFYSTSTPWQKSPNSVGNTTQNTYSCRASYHIMMTDGQWNATTSMPSNLRHDAANITLPDGRSYSQRRPYYDSQAETLADLAMHYWATDLNPSLSNRVPAYTPFKSGDTTNDFWDPRNDPATWQHMTNFVMGLGLTESLNNSNVPWAGSTFTGNGYANLVSGSASWPAASSGSDNNVYDLWHSAINSRGEFFSVDSPDAMVQAFDDILKRIADRKSTAARPAINSGQVSTDINDNGIVKTVSYQTSYASDDNWSGDVKRFEKAWNAQSKSFETSQIWSASANVPNWSTRNIKIAGNNSNGLVDFSWANAGSSATVGTLAYWLNRDPVNSNAIDGRAQQRLQYLRGDRSNEGNIFRQRTGVLGDFYSSTPAVVLGARYLVNTANILENTNTYTAFANTAAQRTPRVYVGGNDGMLHGFNALTGVEEFAFIPSAVFSKLNKLTGSNYSHEFYVEGSPVVADVFDGTSWRTILVGTLKAGGKSIFALDVTTPGNEKLLWEFDDSDLPTDAAVKMGYSFSQPTIARLHNGKWGVVFGNGYDSAGSTNGKAALFLVDAVQGTLLKSLETQGTVGIANGLSTPKLGDFNADGVADYGYAGDLQGNIWRFDLLRNGRSDDNPFTRVDDGTSAINEFEVSYGGDPLFSATFNNTPQPITSAPSLVLHPTGSGYLVVFGTGKFFETADKEGNKNIAQTVYGIWDKRTLGENSGDPAVNRSSLQQQSISQQTTVSAEDGSTRQGRIISNNSIDWTTQNGWYLNLVQEDGEMVVENLSQLGRTIFFQSLVPNDDPCGDGASNWTYAINPFTGGRTPRNSFDYTPTSTNGPDISAIRQDGEGGGTTSQNPDSSFQYCTGQECVDIYPDPSSLGRQSWRRVENEDY